MIGLLFQTGPESSIEDVLFSFLPGMIRLDPSDLFKDEPLRRSITPVVDILFVVGKVGHKFPELRSKSKYFRLLKLKFRQT